MESEGLFIKTNSDNADITDELFNENYKNYTDPFDIQFFKNEKVINEIKETFLDFYNTVPYIQRCVDKDKPRAKDLPRDSKGRIIVDITRPHHLENMDYFRPTAICFEKHGVLTLLKPNGNPNSPYGKWIAEEARRCREGYIRESDGEWIPGDLYFFWNYCPMLMEDYDEEEGITVRKRSFPHMWEGHYYKFHYVWQARRNNMNSAELASRAKGKAHPYSQVVYTPEGKKLWGDIKVGDNLFGDDGNITKVTQIPFDAEEDIYTVSLADGRKLQCTTGHLFYIKDSRKANPMRVASLLEIMESDYAHKRRNGMIEYYYSIPKNGKVEFPEKKTTIDPYVMGSMIGDERIPEDYLFNSSSVRKAVLQGLLDTDGTVNNNGIPMFTTVSEQLANDVRWLCYSLGYNNTMFIKQGKYKDKDGIVHICKQSYNITILTNDDVFRLPRKLCKLDGFHSSYRRSRRDWTKIVNIEYSHREKAKCVIVDNDSHCYLIGNFIVTHNTASAAAMLTRRIELGETSKNKSDVTCIAMASDKKFLTGGDVLLDKFQDNLDFCAEYTEFPRGRIKDTENDLKWEIGYKQNNGPKSGVQNVVLGISSGNSPKKGRGSRAALYIMEEFGSWPNLKTTYSSLRKSVKNGKNAYGLIHLQGTAGDNESDFSSAQDLVRNPDGNDIYALDNVYDKVSQGKRRFPYFFPAYINLIGHYDKDGNSDVVSSLLQIISNRIKIKYNTENPETLIKETAEMPIVPEEAMMRTTGNVFPTTQLNERIGEIEGDPNFFDSTFVGKLVMDSTGNVKFESTVDVPIRFFPHNDNKLKGALEIFEMPQIDPNTKRPFANRYIASQDPVDRDVADTVSLSATFVMDLWTDRIVAEWTGRTQFAEDGYENARLLCMFYNCKLLYENNIAGLYGYFQKMNCLSMLEETPPYLKEKDLVKTLGFGNTAYGVRTTVPIINHGERLIEAWLLAPVKTVDKNGNTITLCNINFIKNLALLKELVMYNRVNNFDRVMALVMLMIFREAKMIMYHGDVKQETRPKGSEAAHDKFFQQYDRKFKHN